MRREDLGLCVMCIPRVVGALVYAVAEVAKAFSDRNTSLLDELKRISDLNRGTARTTVGPA